MGLFDVRPKRIDLSVRQSVPCGPSVPSFSKQNHALGSTGIAFVTDLFVPNCACTVQRVICQLTTDNTIQLLINGEPVSALLTFRSGTVVEFPGFLLPNNAKVSLLVTTNTTVNFDVVWIKEFSLELIQKQLFVSGAATPSPLSIFEDGAPNVAHNQVPIDATVGGILIVAARTTRRGVLIVNHGGADVFLSDGTGSTIVLGLLLPGTDANGNALKGAAVTLPTQKQVRGITAGATQVVSFFEVYD